MLQILSALGLFCAILPWVAGVTVSTKYGDIEGYTINHDPQAHGSFKITNRFLAIPYAAPPTGQLRLKEPQPPEPWKPNVLNAKRYGHVCLQGPEFEQTFSQYAPQTFTYNEDCLTLDVYTPNISRNLPVMFYIHGGGYVSGASLIHQADALAMFGVVVVVIQYRLGPFGFATTGDTAARGNFGMLDQVAALKWTQENIESFGGDPSRVTIFGVSAGGSSVSLQLLSPLSKDLFHQAIAESGVDFSGFASQPLADGIRYAKELAKILDCDVGSSSDMVACLREKDAATLLAASRSIKWTFLEDILWSPVVDRHFLPDTPRNLRKEGKFKKVPYIVSFTSQEGSSFLGATLNYTFQIPTNLNYGVSHAMFRTFVKKFAHTRNSREENADLIADALEFMYTPWPDVDNKDKLRTQLVDLSGDFMFAAPAHEVAVIHSEFAPVYMYEFGHRSKRGTPNPDWMGVSHGDSVPYVFGVPFLLVTNQSEGMSFDDTDRNVSLFIMAAYTNFAKSGDPTAFPGGVEWGRFNSTHRDYLFIDASPKMASNFHPRRMAFWNEYRPKLVDVKFETEKQLVNSGAVPGAYVGIWFRMICVAVATLLRFVGL